MNISYLCPHWGSENLDATEFLDKVVAAGYNGVEINLPEDQHFLTAFSKKLEEIRNTQPVFKFIGQQVLPSKKETTTEYISRMGARLHSVATLLPDAINSHTGKDYYSFDENCKIIDAAQNVSAKTGIRILHETHRGRFSFHAATLLPYLEKFPEMELVGDFSHFCTVSESLLQDQQDIIDKIIPHVSHIHARVGFEQGPQVNDPQAPEWAGHLCAFMTWWQQIIDHKANNGWANFTITPEYGPAPYMPALPNSRLPLSDQWTNNKNIMAVLKKTLHL